MKRWSWCILGLIAGVAIVAAGFPGAGTGEAAPRYRGMKVTAVYDIRWSGLSIGNFSFNSSVNGQDYSLIARASIGDLDIGLVTLPVYKWKAETRSEGAINDGAPKPSSYNFQSQNQSEKKNEKIGLRFTDNTVTQISLSQPIKSTAKRVPITEEHLRNVVDPLSAVMLMSYKKTENIKSTACDTRLPIFDGKMRYDLTFSLKSAKDVEEAGFKGTAYICRVKYTPIAGHKPKDGEDLQKASQNIEVWMIPFTEASLIVPYKIVVPSVNASMTLTKFDVQLPSQARRSLIN